MVQLTAQTNAEQAVFAMFADATTQKLAEKADRNTFQNASKLVDAVRNQAKKKELQDSLSKADELLTKEEKLLAAAQAKASAAASTTIQQSATHPSAPSASPSAPSISSSAPATAVQQPTGLAQFIANSRTAQHTDQIITVVGTSASATVTLWEKSNGVWVEGLKTSGSVGSQG